MRDEIACEPFTAPLNQIIKIRIKIGDLTQNVNLGFGFHNYRVSRIRRAKP